MSSISDHHGQPHESAAVSFRKDAIWIGCLFLYFAALVAARSLLGGESLNWDDAELPVVADLYRPGYGPQLPLYHWYQNALFDVFGISVFTIALGRDLVRLLSAIIMYVFARQAVRPLTAFAVTLGLELNIHFAWYAQRAFSHNNSAILFGLLATFVFWLAINAPRSWSKWLLFGGVCGLGLLSKYNFLFVPVTLVLTAVSDPRFRDDLSWARILVAFALSVAIAAFPYQWIANNLQLATGASGSLDLDTSSFFATRISGLFELGQAIASNAALSGALALLLWAFTRTRTAAPPRNAESCCEESERLGRFLLRYLVCFSLILVIGVLIAGIGNVRDRWLLPVFCLTGPTAVLLIWHRISPMGRGILVGICSFIALAVLIGHPLESRYWRDRGNAPFGPVIETMEEAMGAGAGTYVVAPFQWNAGNLKHRRPDWIVDDYRLLRFDDHGSRPFLLVLDNRPSNISLWLKRFGSDYRACADRPSQAVDTKDSDPGERRLDFQIFWICPNGPPRPNE
ncbi:glycosyltransferase family 39 protein [Notoacmeibacter sp. MSK16QG-6]|uniref:ArnT family glycosyltransferase n=1 Tax=Notoacmeibacter sp. MSK16QG-6 TaxID=2957982 RepID=UPI00209C8623|nr:glycosyltransferase family 39 protein [Notoacmeibacter sp. MSK16QG-6]MCP1200779.1 glycosyltransferase family 39 protein [Notoacmeibacter sp. MSK16QG-6]